MVIIMRKTDGKNSTKSSYKNDNNNRRNNKEIFFFVVTTITIHYHFQCWKDNSNTKVTNNTNNNSNVDTQLLMIKKRQPQPTTTTITVTVMNILAEACYALIAPFIHRNMFPHFQSRCLVQYVNHLSDNLVDYVDFVGLQTFERQHQAHRGRFTFAKKLPLLAVAEVQS